QPLCAPADRPCEGSVSGPAVRARASAWRSRHRDRHAPARGRHRHLPGADAAVAPARTEYGSDSGDRPITAVQRRGKWPGAMRETVPTMTRTHSPRPSSGPPQPPPYNWKATLWLVVGMLVVIGAMGVFMRVIPTPFTQPAPTSVPTPGPTSQPAITPQPAAATAPAATPAPSPLVITLGGTAPTQAAGTQP